MQLVTPVCTQATEYLSEKLGKKEEAKRRRWRDEEEEEGEATGVRGRLGTRRREERKEDLCLQKKLGGLAHSSCVCNSRETGNTTITLQRVSI